MFKSIAPSNPVNSLKLLRKIKDDLLRISPLLLQMEQMNEEDLEQAGISSQLTQLHEAVMDLEAATTSIQYYSDEENFNSIDFSLPKKDKKSSISLRGYIQKEAKRAKRLSGQLQTSMESLQQQVQALQTQYPDDSNELEQELQELFQDQNIAF